MALKIRLARGGAKKRPYYRIVLADSRMPRDGRYIERLGTYDPRAAKDSETRVTMDLEKIKEWMGKGALPTDRVSRMLEAAGVIEKKIRSNPNKAEMGAKAKERLEAKKQKAAAPAPASDEALAEEAATEKPAQ